MRTITIGRSRDCDVVIQDGGVSRLHAEIFRHGNEFIYRDMGKNGTNIGGRMIHNERVAIAPGAAVLLANRIPLPWVQIYALLPGSGNVSSELPTHIDMSYSKRQITPKYEFQGKEDRLCVGWGILAFIVPIAGWIMYFAWKDETPKRAKWAGVIGTISFLINVISVFGM